jgi:hypothetical protein
MSDVPFHKKPAGYGLMVFFERDWWFSTITR